MLNGSLQYSSVDQPIYRVCLEPSKHVGKNESYNNILSLIEDFEIVKSIDISCHGIQMYFTGYAKLRHIDSNLRRPSSLLHTSDSDDDRLHGDAFHRKGRGSMQLIGNIKS